MCLRPRACNQTVLPQQATPCRSCVDMFPSHTAVLLSPPTQIIPPVVAITSTCFHEYHAQNLYLPSRSRFRVHQRSLAAEQTDALINQRQFNRSGSQRTTSPSPFVLDEKKRGTDCMYTAVHRRRGTSPGLPGWSGVYFVGCAHRSICFLFLFVFHSLVHWHARCLHNASSLCLPSGMYHSVFSMGMYAPPDKGPRRAASHPYSRVYAHALV